MASLPYRLDPPGRGRPSIGIIVLQADETVEQDLRVLFAPDGAALHVSRVPSGEEATTETISGMAAALPAAAALFPRSLDFDAVGYACTSGAALIGPDRVRELVRGSVRTRHVTDPTSAALAAFDALGVRRIGIVSPYVPSVVAPLAATFEAGGVRVVASGSFGEASEERVARIAPASIRDAALAVGADNEVEAVFLSCTNLRTLPIIDEAEGALGKPVFGSNLALGWRLAGLAGTPLSAEAPGRLSRLTAAAGRVPA